LHTYAELPRLAKSQLTVCSHSASTRTRKGKKVQDVSISDEAAYSYAIIPDSGFFESFQIDTGEITAIAESECVAMCCFAGVWLQCHAIELSSDNIAIE
jgi:hypothetical protein